MVDYMEMDPLQKVALETAPEMTVLAATRVPDITTKLHILKEIRTKEVSDSFQVFF